MLIEILKRTTCGGQRHDAGTLVEASAKDADTLIAMGKAREIKVESESPVKRQRRRHASGPDSAAPPLADQGAQT